MKMRKNSSKTSDKSAEKAVKTAVARPKTANNAASQAQIVTETDEFYGRMPIKTIAIRTGLDRATVADRLKKYNYQPIEGHEKLKIFDFDAEMEAVLLETNTKLTDAKVRKEIASARQIEIKVSQLEGDLAPVAEFADTVQQLFGAMHKELVVRLPKRIGSRLAKCSNAADASTVLTREINGVFQALRDDHERYLKQERRAA